jgi:hypothetical protein
VKKFVELAPGYFEKSRFGDKQTDKEVEESRDCLLAFID